MEKAGMVEFEDTESREKSMIYVRHDREKVGICVSIISNGDIEVFLSKDDARKVLEVLTIACS